MSIHSFIHSVLCSVRGDGNTAWPPGHSPFPHGLSSITVEPKLVSNKNATGDKGRCLVEVRWVSGRGNSMCKGQESRESMETSMSPVKCKKGNV